MNTPAPPPPSGPRNPALWAGAAIFAAGLLAYHNSLGGPFVFDDVPSIADNPTLRQLWPIWNTLRPPHGQGITVDGRPVLNFSLAVNHAISGTEVWSYHAANLLIHLLAGLTLLGIVRRTLERTRPGLPATAVAFLVALLWTVHPLQTESVTYVVQRAESLMGLFYLLTLYCFIRYAATPFAFAEASADEEAGGGIWAGLSIGCCLLGMGTKEVMVSAPVIVFLYDRTFLAGTFRAAWRMRWRYYLALAACWGPLAALVAAGGGNRSGSSGFGTASWPAYLLTQFPAIARYLRLAFWPQPLVFDYAAFWIAHPVQVLPQALLVLALFAATLWALRRRPVVGFLGAWFFLILAPTSLVPGTTQMIVEHRMYLPLAAVLTLAVCAGATAPRGRRVLFAAAVAAAAFFTAVTVRRNAVYATEVGLWTDTVAHAPGNEGAHNNLGLALRQAGRTTEAIAEFEAALAAKPDYAGAHNNLGIELRQSGRTMEAITQFQAALGAQPVFPEAHNNLGLALHQAGRIADAMAQFREALEAQPDFAEAHNNLGLALGETGQTAEAIAQFQEALRLKPDYAEAHNNFGLALRGRGQGNEAIGQYQEALRLKPDYVEALNNLGLALAEAGRTAEAMVQYQEALRLAPGNATLHFNLGLALAAAGRDSEAIVQYEEALRLRPDYAKARAALLRRRRAGAMRFRCCPNSPGGVLFASFPGQGPDSPYIRPLRAAAQTRR